MVGTTSLEKSAAKKGRDRERRPVAVTGDRVVREAAAVAERQQMDAEAIILFRYGTKM